MKQSEIKLLLIPRYAELDVKSLWALVKLVSDLVKYFIDMDDHELHNRSYLWIVLTTIRTDGWEDLLENMKLEAKEIKKIKKN